MRGTVITGRIRGDQNFLSRDPGREASQRSPAMGDRSVALAFLVGDTVRKLYFYKYIIHTSISISKKIVTT